MIAGLGCMLLAWRALLADLGSSLPLPTAIRVMFIGQLGKYVPGAVWALAAQVELARGYDVPRRRSAAASLVRMATTLVVGLIAAGVILPLTSGRAAMHYWWVLAVAPLVVACLHPKIIKCGTRRCGTRRCGTRRRGIRRCGTRRCGTRRRSAASAR